MSNGPRKNPVASKERTVAPSKRSPQPHVLPDKLPVEVVQLLRQTLQINALVSVFTWIVDHLADTHEPLELAEHLAERYEQQVLRLKHGAVKDYAPVFRVAFAVKSLEILPVFSMRLAQLGYNPLFLRIWFQKRLLADMVGISVIDVERRARASGMRTSDYLNDQIGRLYPQTSLAKQVR
jgi:hypothetical protein